MSFKLGFKPKTGLSLRRSACIRGRCKQHVENSDVFAIQFKCISCRQQGMRAVKLLQQKLPGGANWHRLTSETLNTICTDYTQ